MAHAVPLAAAARVSHTVARPWHSYFNLRRPCTWVQKRRKPLSAQAGFGDFFDSEVVQQDFAKLNKEMTSLAPMMRKFPDFDLEGKRLFLEQMDAFVERFRIFLARLQLTEDPLAKEMLRQLNVQLLEANVSLEGMYQGFKQQTEAMRGLLDEEERTADPEKLRLIRQAFVMSMGAAGSSISTGLPLEAGLRPEDLDLEDLMGIQDPKSLVAFQEVAMDPGAVEKYRDRPALYGLLKKLLKKAH